MPSTATTSSMFQLPNRLVVLWWSSCFVWLYDWLSKERAGATIPSLPVLYVYNNTAWYLDQDSGTQKSSTTIYLELWHVDIFPFLDTRYHHGYGSDHAQKMLSALWIPGLFIDSIQSNRNQMLMCPNECPGLRDAYGDVFNELYTKYKRKCCGYSSSRKSIC